MADQTSTSDQDVMDVSQAADYLKIPENQLQEIVENGTLYDGKGIPHVKINTNCYSVKKPYPNGLENQILRFDKTHFRQKILDLDSGLQENRYNIELWVFQSLSLNRESLI